MDWIKARKNLIDLYRKAPHEGMVIDLLDAAYVAGLDDGKQEQ